MSLITRKISAFAKKVADLADTPQLGSTALLKQQFDAAPEELRVAHNGAMDDLTSVTPGSSGAENIGSAPIAGVAGATPYAQMSDLKAQINSATTGALPDKSITPVKLAFDPTVISYAAATGVANTYAATLNPAPTAYVEGMAVSVKINVDATAASTLNVNGLGAKPLKKSNGTDVTNFKTNGVYTFRYNATTGNFILQGEGGSGTATAADILAPKTATTDAGDVVGTLTIAAGDVRATATVGGVVGTFSQGLTAGAADIASGKTAAVGGMVVTGSLTAKVSPGDALLANASESRRSNPPQPAYFGYGTKKFRIDIASTFRVKFTLAAETSGNTVFGRIYRNGAAYGTVQSTSSSTYTMFSEDLAFNAGDTVQLFQASSANGLSASLSDQLLLCTVSIAAQI